MENARVGARERIADAAMDLFERSGYEETTVDDIALLAGVSRSTFFRHYRSKEDVVFPDHDLLRRQVAERLASSNQGTAIAAVSDAVRLVLNSYVSEGDRAHRRYRLTSSIPTLRNREIASVAPYQRLFREFIMDSFAGRAGSALVAELMAASVVAAHNHVLRRYLRGSTSEPAVEMDAALEQVVSIFAMSRETSRETGIVVFRTGTAMEELVPALRDLVEGRR